MFLCLLLLVAPLHARPVAAPTGPTRPGPVLVLGDSLSAAHNIPAESGWVALLDHRLKAGPRPAPEVINASISGETSAGGLARLPELLHAQHPAVIVIALGGNDGLRGLPPEQLRGNLEAMIALARQAGAAPLLVGIDVPTNYGPAYRERFRAVYAGLSERLGVPLLPFLLEGVALEPELMQDDGIHPTAAAQPRLLENVWPLLEPLLDGRAGARP